MKTKQLLIVLFAIWANGTLSAQPTDDFTGKYVRVSKTPVNKDEFSINKWYVLKSNLGRVLSYNGNINPEGKLADPNNIVYFDTSKNGSTTASGLRTIDFILSSYGQKYAPKWMKVSEWNSNYDRSIAPQWFENGPYFSLGYNFYKSYINESTLKSRSARPH